MLHDTHTILTLPEIPRSEPPKRTTPRLSWLVASMSHSIGVRLDMAGDNWRRNLTLEALDSICDKLLAKLTIIELRDEIHRWRAECRRFLTTGSV